MELIDGVAAIAKIQCEAALRELTPRRGLSGCQIVRQEIHQEFLADHEMRNLFSLQGFVDLIGTLGGANDSEEISRQFAAVVKIIPLAIITSPADKEKINFRRRRRRLVDEAKGRILRQHSLEVCVAAFAAAQITERFRRANIVPKVAPMPCHESYESDKEIDRPLDAEIDVEDAVNSKND